MPDLKVRDMVKWTDPEGDEFPGTITAIDDDGLVHLKVMFGMESARADELTYIDGALTDADRAEFTALNLVAHSILRENKEDGTPPCWLTMSAEAKEAAREAARAFIDAAQGMGFGTMPLVTAEKLASQFLDADKIKMFSMAEESFKVRRAMGEPSAFFAN